MAREIGADLSSVINGNRASMNEIFISYRHADSLAEAGRLYSELARRFGEDSVFLDQSGIESGDDFPEALRLAVDGAEVFLAVIGPQWLAEFAKRAAGDPVDYVLEEIAQALGRDDGAGRPALKIIPLLVRGATMPGDPADLPERIRGLATLDATALRATVADYQRGLEELCTLIEKRTGDLTARRQNAGLMHALKDQKQSRADIGPDIAVLADPGQLIPRRVALEAINAWWVDWEKERRPFALLGDEGDGKSWAVAAWLVGKIQGGFSVPVVYVSATRVPAPDLKVILATALDKSLPAFSQRGWPTDDYCAADGRPTPRFLLVLDGLNERPSEDWRRVVGECLAAPWRDSLAVIFICRTVYWDRHLESFDGEAVRHVLPPYDDGELQQALRLAGRRKEDFGPDILKLMSKPRYFKLAVRYAGQIEQGGATLERLLLEDWRDMTRHRASGEPMTHKEFLAWIRELVANFGNTLDREGFVTRSQGFGDLRELKEEMLSADILREEEDGSLTVQERPLLLGLGLLLAHEVKSAAAEGEASMQEAIDRRMGEQPDMDLRVRVCGMAFLYALSLKDFPEIGLLALLRAWITGRNVEQGDLEEVAAYLPLHPATYLRMAEEVWGKLDNTEVQDVFMSGFLRYRTLPTVQEKLVEAFTEWLGLLNLVGFSPYLSPTPAQLAESRINMEKMLGESHGPGVILNRFGYTLTVTENQELMRLGQVAAAVISHETERLPYCRALASGMLACAAMDGSKVELSWLCQTAEPAVQTELLRAAKAFIEVGQPLAYAAARLTLSILDSEPAHRLRETIPPEHSPEHWAVQYLREHRCDYAWQADSYRECLCAQAWEPEEIAKKMAQLSLQPDISLDNDIVEQLHNAGHSMELGNVSDGRGKSLEDIALDRIEPTLCAFAPERYAHLINALAGGISRREGQSRRLLAQYIYDHLPVLDTALRAELESAWQTTQCDDKDEGRWVEMYLFSSLIYDRSAKEQATLTQQRSGRRGHLIRLESFFRSFLAEELPWVAEFLGKTIEDDWLDKLYQLTESLPQLDDALRERLLAIFRGGKSTVRGLCLEIFCNTQDDQAAQAVIVGGWAANPDEEYHYEAYHGSVLLACFGQMLPFAELSRRISPELLGYALGKRGCQSKEVAAYAELLDAVWRGVRGVELSPDTGGKFVTIKEGYDHRRITEEIEVRLYESSDIHLTNVSWGGTTNGSLEDFHLLMNSDAHFEAQSKAREAFFAKVEAMKQTGNPWFKSSFHNGHLSEVVALPHSPWRNWFHAVFSPGGRRLLFLCQGFYEKLCAALLTHEPESATRLFRELRREWGMKINDADLNVSILLLDLFAAPTSPPVETLRQEVLEDCDCDKALFELALLAESGNHGWLGEKIEALHRSDHHYDQARAWMLEGFVSSAESGERLAAFVGSGEHSWLRKVAETALHNRERDQCARHWFGRFLGEPDRIKSWAAFRLFLRCVDRRFWLWLPETRLPEAEPWKRDAARGNRGNIARAMQENEKDWQDSFIGQKVKHRQLWPWMKDYV